MDIMKIISCGEGAWPVDALQAVKQDPAVIEVQLRVDPKQPLIVEEPEVIQEEEEQASETDFSESSNFDEMMRVQKAALFSLDPQKLNLLLRYAEILRVQRLSNQRQMECAFCKNNGEPLSWYSSHVLRDARSRVRCPVLRGYRCPLCGATGDNAHTVKYCSLNNDRHGPVTNNRKSKSILRENRFNQASHPGFAFGGNLSIID